MVKNTLSYKYYIKDHLGNNRMVTDVTGNMTGDRHQSYKLMCYMKYVFVVIQLLLICNIIVSCKRNEGINIHFDYYDDFNLFMTDYYIKHDCYPKTVDEYLYNAYRDDSIENFELLSTFMADISGFDVLRYSKEIDYFGNKDNKDKSVNFEKYNMLLDVAEGNFLDRTELPYFMWYAFYHYRNEIVLEENDSVYFFNCKSWQDRPMLKKIPYLLKQYVKNPTCWEKSAIPDLEYEDGKDDSPDLDSQIALNIIHRMMFTRIYKREKNSYFHRIENSLIPDSLWTQLQLECNKCYQENSEQTNNINYFLRYDKIEGITDYITKDELPQKIKHNRYLLSLLSNILTYADAECIYFYYHPNN